MRSVALRHLVSLVCHLLTVFGFLFASITAMGQETSQLPDAPQPARSQSGQSNPEQNGREHEVSKNHIFWVIPNYRSNEDPSKIKSLTPGAKMKVTFDDSFDPSAFLVAGVFAGVAVCPKNRIHESKWRTHAFGFAYCFHNSLRVLKSNVQRRHFKYC
jgi:hypothetical protein